MRFSLGYIQREIEALAGKNIKSAYIGKDYSFKLGMICHYYADFFCHAHGSGYRQAIVNHLRYEHSLGDYFVSRLDTVRRIDFVPEEDVRYCAREINERTRKLYKEYEAAAPSYGKDIYYALTVSAGAMVSLVRCSMANIVPIGLINLPQPVILPQAGCAAEGAPYEDSLFYGHVSP
jgi:hypothetical protein